MRIFSVFAILGFPPKFCTVVNLTSRRTVRMFHPAQPCVSFLLMKNTGRNIRPVTSGTAIYAAFRFILSRPILGHTPRKLPEFPPQSPGSSHCAFVSGQTTSLHALNYHIAHSLKCQALFLAFLQKFSAKFSILPLHVFVQFDISLGSVPDRKLMSLILRKAGSAPSHAPLGLPRAATRNKEEQLSPLLFAIHIIISMPRPT